MLIAIANAQYVMLISQSFCYFCLPNHPGRADFSSQTPPITHELRVPLNSLLNLVMPAIGLPNANGYYLSCVL